MARESEDTTVASSTSSLSDLAYERLKTDIVRCVLRPGQEITESQLAKMYDMGKAPLRTALLRLCHERLVEAVPRRGHVVVPITIRDVIDLYEVRLMLEPSAAKLAAGRVDKDRLLELNRACEEAYRPGDLEAQVRYLQVNTQFHMHIAQASSNYRLVTLISDLLNESERIRHLGLALTNNTVVFRNQHDQLIDALIAGDGAAAAQITADHIRSGREMIVNAVLRGSDMVDRLIEPAKDPRAAQLVVLKNRRGPKS